MTEQQELHLKSITTEFAHLCEKKYRKGQEEHGGDLFRKSVSDLIDSALDEAIDQVVYLLTLRQNVRRTFK